jgi:hypothetical protein
MSKELDRLPTIPEYYKERVDPNVDLETEPYQPCPFHNETTGKSLSYSKQLGIFRCFGKCHCGGDVIDMHRLNYRLKSREEAKRSLYSLYNISFEDTISFEKEEVEVDEKDVHRRRAYSLSLKLAQTPDDWIELDYILSKVPYDVKELEVFCASHGHPISSSTNLPS